MSDIESIPEEPEVDLPIVEVSKKGRRRDDTDDDDDSDYNDDDFESEESGPLSEEDLPPSPRELKMKSGRIKKVKKGRNGTHHVDMTPPEDLLKDAEKRLKQYMKTKQDDKAIREMIRCVALCKIVYGDTNWRLGQAYCKLADGYLSLKGYGPQAHQHAVTAKKILASEVHLSTSDQEKENIRSTFLDAYYTMGRALCIMKKYNEAEQALIQAEKLSKQSTASSKVKLDTEIKVNLALAKVNARQQKHASAMASYEHAKELVEKKSGRDSLDLIPINQALGQIELSKGRHANHEVAIGYYQQAHSIAAAKYPPNSVESAETARALATAYSKTDNEDLAEKHLNECLIAYEVTHGIHHTKSLEIQDDRSRLMIRNGRTEEAVSLLKSTIAAKKEVYGEFSDEVADTYKLLGHIHLSNGELEMALKEFKKCHNIQVTRFGVNDKRTKEIQGNIDVLMVNPAIAAKEKINNKNKNLDERPRFSSIVSRSKPVGSQV